MSWFDRYKSRILACCSVSIVLFVILGLPPILRILSEPPEPKELKFTVTNAYVAQFDFSRSNNTLSYKLELNIRVENPNAKGGLFFDSFQVLASYRKQTFAIVSVNSTPPLYLRSKSSATVQPAMEGRAAILLNDSDAYFYHSETRSRVYTIDTKLALRLRNVTVPEAQSRLEPPKIDCDNLRIPLRDNNSWEGLMNRDGDVSFNATKCRGVDIFIPDKIQPGAPGLYG